MSRESNSALLTAPEKLDERGQNLATRNGGPLFPEHIAAKRQAAKRRPSTEIGCLCERRRNPRNNVQLRRKCSAENRMNSVRRICTRTRSPYGALLIHPSSVCASRKSRAGPSVCTEPAPAIPPRWTERKRAKKGLPRSSTLLICARSSSVSLLSRPQVNHDVFLRPG